MRSLALLSALLLLTSFARMEAKLSAGVETSKSVENGENHAGDETGHNRALEVEPDYVGTMNEVICCALLSLFDWKNTFTPFLIIISTSFFLVSSVQRQLVTFASILTSIAGQNTNTKRWKEVATWLQSRMRKIKWKSKDLSVTKRKVACSISVESMSRR